MTRLYWMLIVWAMLGAVATSPASAQAISLERAAADIRPGQYLWRDHHPIIGDISIVISLPQQLALVYRADRLVGVAAVSTGKRDKPTPTGEFTILQKRVFHRSNLYSNAPMPHMQRLTWDGIALHAGHNPGYPASHGCIRLPPAFARLLFGATELGGAVAVIGDEGLAPPTARDELPVIIADMAALNGARFALVTFDLDADWSASPSLTVGGDQLLVPDARLWLPERRG